MAPRIEHSRARPHAHSNGSKSFARVEWPFPTANMALKCGASGDISRFFMRFCAFAGNFYMTDAISRSSQTMAKCTAAFAKQ